MPFVPMSIKQICKWYFSMFCNKTDLHHHRFYLDRMTLTQLLLWCSAYSHFKGTELLVLRLIQSEIWKCANPKYTWKLKMQKKKKVWWADKFLPSLNSALDKHHGVSHMFLSLHILPQHLHTFDQIMNSESNSVRICALYFKAQRAGKANDLTSFLIQRAIGSWVTSWQPDDSCVSGLD